MERLRLYHNLRESQAPFSKLSGPGVTGAGGGLDVKIAGSVVEADTLHDLLQGSVDIGILAVFHPGADEVAQNAAEIVMPGVAEEGAGVGEHADKVA